MSFVSSPDPLGGAGLASRTPAGKSKTTFNIFVFSRFYIKYPRLSYLPPPVPESVQDAAALLRVHRDVGVSQRRQRVDL